MRDLVETLASMTSGRKLQQVMQQIVLRKVEALPLVLEKLHDGTWFEKHMMTKLLRCGPWPEAHLELLHAACSEEEHWLVREGALYALAELANKADGTVLYGILTDPDTPLSVRRVAVATLARIGYTEAAKEFWSLTNDADMRMRVFANRALVELGMKGDIAFLLSALNDDNAIVREEACGALALAPGSNIAEKLAVMEEKDSNEVWRAQHARRCFAGG